MLHVIQDERTTPAHFGVMAALFAQTLRARGLSAAVMHLPSLWDLLDYPEAVQHVDASGILLPSGLLWSERLLGTPATRVADVDTLMRHAGSQDMVLALHPGVDDNAFLPPLSKQALLHRAEALVERSPDLRLQRMRDILKLRAQASGTAVRTYSAQRRDGVWSLIADDTKLVVQGMHDCRQDRFGRWQANPAPRIVPVPASVSAHVSAPVPATASESESASTSTSAPASATASVSAPASATAFVSAPAAAPTPAAAPALATERASVAGIALVTNPVAESVAAAETSTSARRRPLHVALLGSERDQYGGYPATLAALGDAADAAGIDLAIDFVIPQTLTQETIAARLRDVDGIVLPGGSDMARVAGQIEAARYAYGMQLPIVGLCLGMQSMATAVARIALNDEAIGLAEVGASCTDQTFRHSFVPLDASGPTLHHRLGDQRSQLMPGSQLQAILGEVTVTRYNHRYGLNDDLIGPLKTAGVYVCARGAQDAEANRVDQSIDAPIDATHDSTNGAPVNATHDAPIDTPGYATTQTRNRTTSPDQACTRYVDAIEAPAHPFFIGMQGHPELTSSEAHPHPLLVAFLRAALAESRKRR